MSMFNKVTKTFQWGQHTVTMETGEIARQSSGAVMLDIDGLRPHGMSIDSKGHLYVGEASTGRRIQRFLAAPAK